MEIKKTSKQYDVIIVGSGPSGIAAAIEAAEKKLDVILVEQDSLIGGDQLSENEFDSSHIENQTNTNKTTT